MNKSYLGLGGNIGNSFEILNNALINLSKTDQIFDLCVSRPFVTAPVSPIPQNCFINAVCVFNTNLSIDQLFQLTQKIEASYGKISKSKSAPRPLDIDILFYHDKYITTPAIEIPHPRWQQRLFVIAPLCDLTDEITLCNPEGTTQNINLKHLLATVLSDVNQKAEPLDKNFSLG